MVKLGARHAQKYELEKKHWDDLTEIDSTIFKIYDLNLEQIKILLERFEKIEDTYKSLILEKFNR